MNISKIKGSLLTGLAGTIATMAASPSYAQDVDNATTAAQSTALEEIVVTAQRRSENLQKVPVAVSAIGGEALASANITNASELGRLVPALTVFTTTGAVQPFLRGIGNPGSLIGNESSVAVYVDDVYMARVPPALLQLSSVERVEVLKGPQGTLFGRNASGGLLHVITRTPSESPAFEASVGYGNYNTIRGSIYATTGIAQGLALDISAMTTHQGDGWGRNVGNGRDWGKEFTQAIRTKLRWQPGSTTTIDLSADYTRSETDLIAQSQFLPGTPRGYELPPYGLQPLLGFYDIEADSQPKYNTTAWGVSGKVTQELSFADLISITAYREDKSLGVFDSDYSRQPFLLGELYGRVKQFTQEIQLSSSTPGPVKWIVGAFYLNSRAGYEPSRFTGQSIDAFTGGLPAVSDTYGIAKNKSYAAFGQATYRITDSTGITAGLRYTHDKISGYGRNDFYLAGTNPVIPGPVVSGSETFNKLTWKASIDQQLTDNAMIYLSYSRGYKAGLYNTLPFTPTAAKPEVLDSTEAGFKSELFGRRLRLNGAIFYYDFKNAQFQAFDGPTVTLVNAKSARVYGAEIEGQVAVTDKLGIRFSGSRLDAKYKTFDNAQTPQVNPNTDPSLGPIGGFLPNLLPFDASGNRMVRVPKWTYSVGANYRIETSAGELDFDVNYSYSSSFFWDADNVNRQNGFGLLDAQAKWTLPGVLSNHSIRLWGKNLTTTHYYVAAVPSSGARGTSAMPGAPRSYGFDWMIKL